MDAFTLQPGGGSHAVFTNAVRHARATSRPAASWSSATRSSRRSSRTRATPPRPTVAGFKVITVMPDENGYPDLEAVQGGREREDRRLMITNPEDTGIYNPHIDKYVEMVHDAGALAYTDQANANGILGIARARDAGFDACHFNLHKTFSSPHGCEGPATGAYMVHRRAGAVPAGTGRHEGRRDATTSTTTGRRASAACAASSATGWRSSAPTPGSATWVPTACGGRRDLRAQQQLPRQAAHGDRRREPAVRRRPPPARPGALQPGEAQGGHRRRHRGRPRPHGRLRHPEPLDEPPSVGGARAVHARALRDLQQRRPRRVGGGHRRRSATRPTPTRSSCSTRRTPSPSTKMRRTEAMEDPDQWAFTWRKYKKKFKDRV